MVRRRSRHTSSASEFEYIVKTQYLQLAMTSLPPLSDALASSRAPDSPLATVLSILFEPSPVLLTKLVPEVASHSSLPTTYASLIDLAVNTIASWDAHSQATFISGHPRIGELTNLSHLSQQEQAAKATPADVLDRLAFLNVVYEQRYPGLRYITFVNGRSRAEIRDEMERMLRMSGQEEERISEEIVPVEVGGREWMAELNRAIVDVGQIAKSRLRALGVV